MARSSNVRIALLAFAAIVLMFVNGATARGMKTLTDLEIEGDLNRINKPAVKTIKSLDGDIIDCVDIYKQPAFDHPLLKNHTIQMRPSDYDDGRKPSSSLKLSGQLWRENGSCPEGTIPIPRIQKSDLLRASSEGFGMNAAAASTESVKLDMENGNLGGSAVLNIWNIHVEPGEFSSASVFVGYRDEKDFVTAGWMVSSSIFGDDKTRPFGYWASDNGGCFNLRCAGFVQTNKDVGFGFAFSPVSTYGGDQYEIRTKIYQDTPKGNWWLAHNEAPIGYWPSSLFKNMVKVATYVQWGGQVSNTSPGGKHTSTQMGSGQFPTEGFKRAAYIDEIVYFEDGQLVPTLPPIYETKVDKGSCYGISEIGKDRDKTGLFFSYGGPGGPNCG